jgi:hypothetical protein
LFALTELLTDGTSRNFGKIIKVFNEKLTFLTLSIFLISYGHRLASCVNIANSLLREWNEEINNLHTIGMLTGNQVQNLGMKVLAETAIFDGRNSLPQLVNNELRDLLRRALPYRLRFDTFVQRISTTVLETIRELIACDETLEEDFAREVELDVARARSCIGEVGGEQTPAPTM